jgi:hypothetical protein
LAAVADFNGDGKPDVLQYGNGELLVLLGNGDGTFQTAIPTYTGGVSPNPQAAADLNGDGRADVVGIYGSSLLVYLNNGNGTFASATAYNLNPNYFGQSIVFGDFNGDGKLDVAVTMSGANSSQIMVFLGNGDGTLQTTPQVSPAGSSLSSAVAGDFNGDGKLDLAIQGSGGTYILFGNGDGTFQAPTLVSSTAGLLGAADLTGDHVLDLIVFSSPFVQVLLGDGHGAFSPGLSYMTTIGGGSSVAVADFNLDGKPDVAVNGIVFLGNGNGTFRGEEIVPLPAGPTAAVVGDFGNNGIQDVAAIAGTDLYVLLNDGTGVLTLAQTYTVAQSYAIATGDFNGDGNLDLLLTSQGWGYSVLLGNGDGSFQSPVFYQQGSVEGYPQIVVGDFNNNHKLDFAVNLSNLGVLLGNGDGTFAAPVYYPDGAGQANIMAADFNSDGNLDFAVGLSKETALLFGKGDGTFGAPDFSLGDFAAIETADFNKDGKADLIGRGTNGIQVLLGKGDGTFTPETPLPFPGGGSEELYLFTPDINGDGIPDVLASQGYSGEGDSRGGVFLGKGDGTFGPFIYIPQIFIATNFGAQTILEAADMNNDGKPDLVIGTGTFSGSNGIFVLLNTLGGNGQQLGLVVPTGGSNTQTVQAGSVATYSLSIGGMGWSGQVTLSCTGAPTGATCSFPAGVSMNVDGSGATQFKVTVSTTAPSMTAVTPSNHLNSTWLWAMGLVGFVFLPGSPRVKRVRFGAGMMTVFLVLLCSCGGGGGSGGGGNSGGTPAGTYQLTVTATSGSINASLPLKLIVQ